MNTVPMQQEMRKLFHAVEVALSGRGKKVIQFISPRAGGGASTIVEEFAEVLSTTFERSVLVLSCSKNEIKASAKSVSVQQRKLLATNESDYRADDDVSDIHPDHPVLSKPLALKLYDSEHMKNCLDKLKAVFDYILIDIPPNEHFPPVLSDSDGIIVIIEHEKTRIKQAKNAIREIERQNGKIIGSVLNKRRRYIPENIYRTIIDKA